MSIFKKSADDLAEHMIASANILVKQVSVEKAFGGELTKKHLMFFFAGFGAALIAEGYSDRVIKKANRIAVTEVMEELQAEGKLSDLKKEE